MNTVVLISTTFLSEENDLVTKIHVLMLVTQFIPKCNETAASTIHWEGLLLYTISFHPRSSYYPTGHYTICTVHTALLNKLWKLNQLTLRVRLPTVLLRHPTDALFCFVLLWILLNSIRSFSWPSIRGVEVPLMKQDPTDIASTWHFLGATVIIILALLFPVPVKEYDVWGDDDVKLCFSSGTIFSSKCSMAIEEMSLNSCRTSCALGVSKSLSLRSTRNISSITCKYSVTWIH